MAGNITFDTSDFDNKMKAVLGKAQSVVNKAISDVANEILRLSSFEVPHDKGLLQTSGNVQLMDEEAIVGYNKVYAARLHEHPEYKFQKGRKGKYLEDPIKNNLSVFMQFYKDTMGEMFSK